ncbi:putative extragenic suppressor of kinetochore protein 1 [Coleophoma crateriformis]|uniref:Putative extragenic suppressor of kinetochore protein 1 n=1 Tax=Coleophoma crateriformis TaxID=565419 RepID=A0A3D8R3A5_9HELO|nr:putative extragenic suppressor of kinetochore protein 1 [Coleophoma crateriformis]
MFWRFGGYANISTIDTILDKPDVTLEELLDESDLIQELKQHNTKLIEYLREEKVLEKLLEYVIAPKVEPAPEEPAPEAAEDTEEDSEAKGKERSFSITREAEDEGDEKEKKRTRYAYVSAEVLSSDNWSISEALMENQELLRKFWDFLKLPPPLDPLQASYFTKVNEALLDKKTEEMLELFKSLDGAVKDMLQHVDSPMVMDLLLKIISLEKAEGGQGIVDWLHSQDLMPILLSFLSSEHSWATQTSAGDFLKAIITISANASQNEQSCIGPNELTRQLVSKPCVEKLITDMLKGGNPLTVGVGIVIEVIRKNNSDYDPDVGAEAHSTPSSRDPIYLGTLLRLFSQHVPDFMELILSPNHTIGGSDGGPVTIRRKELSAAFGGKIEPLGFDRFKTCELMAELLHCSNMGLLNEVGSEEFVRARDAERERLRSEGKLGVSHDQSIIVDDDLTMKSSLQSHGSPSGSRKLEVQNASDDDGFEEVTHSADLGDDAKDDFDEKLEGPGEDLLAPVKAPAPLSFLDKDDEDFVDEPLSSPRFNIDPEIEPPQLLEPEMTVEPLSPSKDLARDLSAMEVDDTSMTTPPPAVDESEEVKAAADPSEGTPEPEAAELAPEAAKVEAITTAELPQIQEPEGMSPHPDDKPAPLFAKPAELAEPEAAPVGGDATADTLDTTMGEAGDSSVVMTHQEASEHSEEALPVVGDFLKMQFVEHRVVPTILDFFFRFPWNNFLHNVVYDVVQQVFNGPMERGFNRTLAIDLFETGNITMRIVDGQKKSDEAQVKSKMRLGYMGHLTLIAEEVVKFTERHPPELLSDSVLEKVMNGEWITYVEVTLAETRERDNAILGGVRPDMSVGPRQAVMNAVNAANNYGGSSALADAGLNGTTGLDSIDLANGNGNAGGSFTLTSGTLLSGFGSSSDEEDDEMDEDNDDDGSRNHSGAAEVGQTYSVPPAPNLDTFDDEDIDYEYLEKLDREAPLFPEGGFSRYITTPSTTVATTSDLEPPSAPPPGVPPPPLNIPPSRARRQLAARLALHSKQNSESNNSEESEHRKNLNPFATDEDDDEDEDEDEGDFTIGDLEAEQEGKGLLPPATGLEGDDTKIAEVEQDVGLPALSSRASFPSMWPFGSSGIGRGGGFEDEDLDDFIDEPVANELVQILSDVSSDEDAEKPRRLSATTEAKRRTSLEDDDEEVVHVERDDKDQNGVTDKKVEGDDELVEIQHDEMQTVDAADKEGA